MRLSRRIRPLLLPPALGDAEATRIATTVYQAGLIFGAISLIWCAVWLLALPSPTPNALAGALMGVGVVAPIALARRGLPRAAAVALVGAIWLVTTATLLWTGGIKAPGFSTYTVGILIAGLLLGGRAAAATALVSALTGAALAWIEASGRLPEPLVQHTLLTTWWVEAVLFLATGGTLWLALARQREARDAVARSEERLRLAAEAARMRFWDVDLATGRVTSGGYPVPGFADLGALDREAVRERIHREDRPRVERAFRELVERGTPLEDEARVRGTDDRWHWLAVRAGVERDARGRVVRAVVAGQDVTDRKEAEAIGERLRQALDQTADAVLLLDAEMCILYANPAFDRMLDVRTRAAVGEPAGRLAADTPRRRELFEVARAHLLRGEPWRGRFEIAAPDGSPAVWDAHASPVRGPDGGVSGYVLLIRDVTREVRLEEELRRAQKLEAVGQLAGGVAHDFNNLLTVIVGFLEVVRSEAGDLAAVREPVERIREASERAAELTRQLLALGRREVTQLRVLDLGRLVEESLPLLRGLLPESVAIDWERPAEPAPVEADAGALQQLLLNLAANARDAMPEGGRLALRVESVEIGAPEDAGGGLLAPGRYVRLEVRDTGIGMDAETQERIFEPFFTTKEPGRGTGLGLASAYGTVDQLGGAIAVSSAPGRGTALRIHLPRAEAASAPEARGAERPPAVPADATVLVAEDDAAVRRLVCTTLRRHGFEVLEARDGREALDRMQARSEPVDLLVTDVVMPRLSGPGLAERLRARWPGLRVLLVSGYPRSEAASAPELPAGATVLHKPFPPEALLHRVRAALLPESAPGESGDAVPRRREAGPA